MDKNFFELSLGEQNEIIMGSEVELGVTANAIEKDIWVCWILNQLFQQPIPMAFKGGTSLSKVFGLINRFSEDVDITINNQHLIQFTDIEKTSKSQIKKIRERLKQGLSELIHSIIMPFFADRLRNEFPNRHNEFMLNADDGETIRFQYPSVINSRNKYLRDHVLIEFGIVNSTEPNEQHTIEPILAQAVNPSLSLPIATVNVLSPVRTFWEKATLIHVECHRGRLSVSPDRLSRHWYDLSMLTNSWVGDKALDDIAILENVIKFKKAFYNARYCNYDDCLSKNFRLIPNHAELKNLSHDYKMMLDSGMFPTTPPDFDDVIDTLSALMNRINAD